MRESSIVIFAESHSLNRYRGLGVEKESLTIFSCAEAGSVIEGLKAHVVIVDCGVRTKRGLKLLKEIKAWHPEIPVIFITDSSSEELAITAFRSGAREYYANPVNQVRLKKTINQLIEIRKKASSRRTPFLHVPDAELESIADLEPIADLDDQKIPARLRESLLHIDESLTEKLTLSSLAQNLRMSKYHFSRFFRKHIGMSPMKYVNAARIRRAKELLNRDDLRISEIAHMVGYDDLSAFLRNFKKSMGTTPTEFRNRPGGDACGKG